MRDSQPFPAHPPQAHYATLYAPLRVLCTARQARRGGLVSLTPAFLSRPCGRFLHGSASFAVLPLCLPTADTAPRGVNLLFSYKLRLGREKCGGNNYTLNPSHLPAASAPTCGRMPWLRRRFAVPAPKICYANFDPLRPEGVIALPFGRREKAQLNLKDEDPPSARRALGGVSRRKLNVEVKPSTYPFFYGLEIRVL